MKKWKRSVLFWTFALLFLITTPVVVLNARGYRFDIKRGVFVYSGTITFKSNPQNVNVKLNNEITESKKLNMINNSYNLSGLLPGPYLIEISADGFHPWSKKTDVHSGLANEFWNILLVRKNYEKTDNKTPGIDKFFTSSGGNQIAYTVPTEENLIVNILDAQTNEPQTAFNLPGWQFIDPAKKENIEWSPDGNFISIPVQKALETPADGIEATRDATIKKILTNYYIFDIEKETGLNLNEFLSQPEIYNVRWDSREENHLYFLSQHNLFRANINDGSQEKIAENVTGFDISGDTVYYATLNNNLIFRLEPGGNITQITSTFPGPEELKISHMIVYDERRIAILMQNNDLYIFNRGEKETYFRKLDTNIREAHFSDDGKKMMFWSNFEISVYYLRDELSQPSQNENEKFEITRYSEPLSNVQWFNDYEHIIFSTGRWTKIIELDPRDKRNCMDILNTGTETPFVVYSTRLKKIFFTDKNNDSSSLYSIPFPEETSLLGAVGLGQ